MSIPTISDIAGVIVAPELKHTNSGKAILNVRLAFNDSKYDEQTQKWVNSKTFYVDGQAWEQTAERLYDQLAQGDQIYVTGRIETQSWEKDGEKKSKPVLNISTARKLAKGEPATTSRNTTSQGQQQGNRAGSGNNTPEDPWATPGVSNSGGWGNGPDSEPPF
jgi:single-strand DNA-binding protein